ncbi:MAG: Sec-independent protein translocase protein TatB [Rhodovarius sp.]|nr:Sec-independent protein translocase protein TatB [Rhodovarius sp.]
MFDLAWSEILLIAIVALIIIGPKQLPETLRGIARGIAKAKQAFRDFQAQADELVREANLQEVRDQIQDVKRTLHEIRSFDLKSSIEKTVDPDGSLSSALSDPLAGTSYTPPAWTPPPTAATTPDAPAFIPPSTLAPYEPPPPPPPPPTAATVADAPGFLPPSAVAPPAEAPAAGPAAPPAGEVTAGSDAAGQTAAGPSDATPGPAQPAAARSQA